MRKPVTFGLIFLASLGLTVQAENAGVASVKTDLLKRLNLQKAGTAQLETAAHKYLALAKLATQSEAVRGALKDA